MLGASAEITRCNSGWYAARHPSSKIFASVPKAFANAGIVAIGTGVRPVLSIEMMLGLGESCLCCDLNFGLARAVDGIGQVGGDVGFGFHDVISKL
jgi:hypothetical protein